jgi:hypothetical protein
MKKAIIILISALFIIGCSNNKHNGVNTIDSKADSAAIRKNYENIINAQSRAATDSAYRNSEAYRYAMENYHRNIAEKTKGLSHVEQLLYEYETAINSLYETGRNMSMHPDKMKSKRMQEKMRDRGQEALKLYQQLEGMKMTPAEKNRFDALNKKKPIN